MADLADRAQLETEFATRLSRLSSRHRREMVRLMGAPPRYDNVPESFWQKVQDEQEAELVALLLLVFISSATQHGLAADRAGQLGQKFSARRAGQIAAKYVAHSRGRLRAISDEWQQRQREAESRGEPTPGSTPPPGPPGETMPEPPTTPRQKPAVTKIEIQDKAVSIFGPDRDAKIAISETTTAATEGGEAAAGETFGVSPDDVWWTENDQKVCPVCRPLHRTKRGSKQWHIGPPAHPGCRCWIEYANQPTFANSAPNS